MMKKFFTHICQVFYVATHRYIAAKHAQRAILLTYYTLFAIVPLVALLFGIAKGFSLYGHLRNIIEARAINHKEMFDYIGSMAETTLSNASGGIIAGIGVVALLWTVIWLITSIEEAFNSVWDLPTGRSWWRKLSNCLSLTLFTPFLIIITGTSTMVMRQAMLRMADRMPILIEWQLVDFFAGLISVLFICILFSVIYYGAPNTRVRFRSALFAGLVAGIGFVVLQEAFLLLQRQVFSYNRLYGGFAALPLFLVWMNWSWQVVLYGVEISFVSQNLAGGIFKNGKEKPRTLKLIREHQLAVIRMVFTNFCDGKGATPELKIFAKLRLPDALLRLELNELLKLKVFCRTVNEQGEVLFLPGVPPEKFTVLDFLRLVDGGGDGETPDFAPFEKLLNDAGKSLENSELNLPVVQISNINS